MKKLYSKSKKSKLLNDEDLTYFFEQLSIFFNSGIENWEALLMMSENQTNIKNKGIYNLLYKHIINGMFLAKAMEKSNAFPEYAVTMINLAEQTGRTKEVSKSLAKYYAEKDQLSKAIKSAIAYPVFLCVIVAVIAIFLLMNVMPVFGQIFEQLGLVLNPLALQMLNLGEMLNRYNFIILFSVLFICSTFFMLTKSKLGTNILKRIALKIKFTKKLNITQNTNKFAFAMYLMLKSQVDPIVSLELSKTIVENEYIKNKIEKIIKSIDKGESMQNAIIFSEIFKADYNGLIVAGVRGGELDDILKNISDKYANDAKTQTDKLIEIIEPLSVATLCLMVGIIILSALLPLIGIINGV